MKKISVGFMILTSLCFGQEDRSSVNSKFSSDQLKNDFSLLVNTLKEVHPGVYHFISEDSLNKLSEQFLSNLSNSMTQAEFHLTVRRFIRVIGCGHVTAKPSAEWYQERIANPYLIPLNVYIIDRDVYVRDALDRADTIQKGWKILAIDGVLIDDLLNQLYEIHERDGFNETFERKKIEKSFQTYYLFLSGVKKQFDLVFETVQQDTVTLKLDYANGRIAKNDPSIDFRSKVVSQSNEFGILAVDSTIALLDLNSFDSKGYKKFYKKGFKLLEENGVEHLVVDLRANGGGYFPNGNQLLRYLLNDDFTTNFWTKNKKVRGTKNLSMDPGSRITRKLFNLMPDKDKVDPNRNYEIRYRKIKKNHFDGEIVVFTDGATFSMGSYVASKLKNIEKALVIGEETGGGEAGFNAVLSWSLELPNSKIRVSVPNYHIDLLVHPAQIGRGVLPDVVIQYTIEDKISQRDLELEFFLNSLDKK